MTLPAFCHRPANRRDGNLGTKMPTLCAHDLNELRHLDFSCELKTAAFCGLQRDQDLEQIPFSSL